MSAQNNYRLKKDICLPGRNVPLGAIYVPYKDGKKYYNKEHNHYISTRTLKASTDWFEEVKKVVIDIEKLWRDFIGSNITEQKITVVKNSLGFDYFLGNGTRLCEWSAYVRLFEQLQEVLKRQFEKPKQQNDFTLKEFIEKFIGKNTLIRLWHKDGPGHKEFLAGPEMEWKLLTSEFADRKVLYIKDITMLHSNYAEAINIVLECEKKTPTKDPGQTGKPALFITSGDKVALNIGDSYWYFSDKNYKLYGIKICTTQDIDKGFINFSTEDAAIKYAAKNSVQIISTNNDDVAFISINDIRKYWESISAGNFQESPTYEFLEKLRKEKLKM